VAGNRSNDLKPSLENTSGLANVANGQHGSNAQSDHVALSSSVSNRGLAGVGFSSDDVLNSLTNAVVLVDQSGIIRYVTEEMDNLSGFSQEELLGQPIEILVPTAQRKSHPRRRLGFSRNPVPRLMGAALSTTLECKDGSEVGVEIGLGVMSVGTEYWTLAVVRDVSVQQASELARAEIEQRFRLAFENNMSPMLFTDLDDKIIAVNDAFCQMLGRTKEEILGYDSKPFTHPEDVGITEQTHSHITHGELRQARYVKRYLHKNGRTIIVEVSKSPACDATGKTLYYIISERDITEEQALVSQLKHQALHDPLTGLPNRALFEDRLSQAHARVARDGGLGAVVMVDLDDFKGVNDALGHGVGDQLLIAVAQRLEQVTRSSDTLCRVGGDEFLYLAEGLTSVDEANDIAQRLHYVLAVPFNIAGAQLEQAASVGVAVWDAMSLDYTELIQNADVAMYEAKRNRHGNSRHVVFAPGMHDLAVSRFTLIQELRHALHTGELSMHYQPIVDLTTTEVVGFEALMRWQHPERGWVPPGVFIPLAEESELISELGSFALHQAIATASTWERAGDWTSQCYVTVNLSAHQFHSQDLVTMIERELVASGLSGNRLLIEITESVTLRDVNETLGVIEQLALLGIGIALDDFGTGYTSLSYLAQLRPKVIKIDMSFVHPLEEIDGDDTLLEAIISLGNKFGITMLAEGIETSRQFVRLRQLGCELGQGYLFSKAVPSNQLAAVPNHMQGNLGPVV
jgi:diguanylate cyclase (GGDEF)-like protein/PAS domain S-box-containing protein